MRESGTVVVVRTGLCIIRFAGLRSGEPCIKLISIWGWGKGRGGLGSGKFYVTSIKML